MVTAKITSKGQITLPKAVRDSLQLRSGDRIEFVMHDAGEAMLRPMNKSVDEVFGRLHRPGVKPLSVEEIDAAIRRRTGARKR